MQRPHKICLVTNASISQNPRVVKEADALVGAGYDVTVVFAQQQLWAYPLDETIVNRSAWRALSVRANHVTRFGAGHFLWQRMRRKVFALLARGTFRFAVAERAFGLFVTELTALAVRQRAHLYIGHNPTGLVAAAWAAQVVGVGYAFDAEDFHTGEYPRERANSLDRRIVRHIEEKYLAGCRYVTAASPGIARALSQQYGIALPTTVRNVFPWSDRHTLDGCRVDRAQQAHAVSFYWFSQIVSLDRGLQEAIEALSQVRANVALHIRGVPAPGAVETLHRLAERHGIAGRVFFHPLIPPEQLLSRAAEHDVGLCLEQPHTVNRDICLTNKLFLHLLAGNAVIATRTQGQHELLGDHPDMALLYPPGDVNALAGLLHQLSTDPVLLTRMKKAALAAAATRWNWEHEQVALLDRVKAQPPAG
jgi:glycosyltransferase involved in cell wall biosynthesis